jgi:hypothetical protein
VGWVTDSAPDEAGGLAAADDWTVATERGEDGLTAAALMAISFRTNSLAASTVQSGS